MGFFKDFKEDFSDAMSELVPGADKAVDATVAAELENAANSEELSKLDDLLQQASAKVEVPNQQVHQVYAPVQPQEPTYEEPVMATTPVYTAPVAQPAPAPVPQVTVSDENAIITAGMRIMGNMESLGSIEIQGAVTGDVKCNGKLVVTGNINGNSSCAEFFADAAKIEGEVITAGTAKVGVGSIIIGNITATSAVIAGAVKGDIDVQGPVVVDTSAVVMGNIKSRSVQINNGAVIEGFCSQSYSDVDVETLFN